uniref:Oxidized purine nucleoside triphosphate hydrolase n=1 Tax=Lygus hesperus TaxID=30085 RepID=A0A0K8THC5_LYGHE
MRILRSSIVLVKKDGHFLLGYNKRGFSRDKWTGFGGVVQPKEDLKMCALRNTREQCGLTLEKLEKVGKIEVKFAGVQELVQMHIFVSDTFTGELQGDKRYEAHVVPRQRNPIQDHVGRRQLLVATHRRRQEDQRFLRLPKRSADLPGPQHRCIQQHQVPPSEESRASEGHFEPLIHQRTTPFWFYLYYVCKAS